MILPSLYRVVNTARYLEKFRPNVEKGAAYSTRQHQAGPNASSLITSTWHPDFTASVANCSVITTDEATRSSTGTNTAS